MDASSDKSAPAGAPPKPYALTRPQEALRRLHVRPEELEQAPSISPMLERVLGHPHRAVEHLRMAENAAVQPFLEAWDSIPADDRETLPLEAVCIKAGISPVTLLGAVMMGVKTASAMESMLKATLAHPQVIETTVEMAKDGMYGFQDRKLMHTALGWLPSPKGANISFNMNMNGEAKLSEDDDDDGFEDSFPSIQKDIQGWADNRRSVLEKRK